MISSILALMYALTLVERTYLLFFFKCNFAFVMTFGEYLHTDSNINPIYVGKRPFFYVFDPPVFTWTTHALMPILDLLCLGVDEL